MSDDSAEPVRAELERIASSPQFRKADRLVALLRFVVEETLAGRGGGLKEYTLGVSVFERPADYETKADPVVRLEMRRLRLKLAEYYQTQSEPGAIRIEIPKGAYLAVFHVRPAEVIALPEPTVPRRKRWFSPAVAAAVFVVSIAAAFVALRPQPASAVRRSVAVIGLQDLSAVPEKQWLETALAEMLSSELALGHRLRSTSQDQVANMRTELGIRPIPLSKKQLEQIGANLGVDMIVTGSFAVVADRIRLDLRAIDARSGDVLSAVSESGGQPQLFDLVSRAGSRMRSELGVAAPESKIGPQAALPSTPGAMELYAKALVRLREMDAPAARDLLEQAAAADESNPLVMAALASTWSTLGYDGRARKAAEKALSLAALLGPSERSEVEAKCRTVLHQWDKAASLYAALLLAYPDDIEVGLMLATIQFKAGKAVEAGQTISTLRRLPARISGDPRLDLLEARVVGQMSDYRRTAALAHSSAEKAKVRGARFAYARARLLEAGAEQTLGGSNAAALREEARAICQELGDKACVATALRIEGNVQATNGQLTKARATFGRALEFAREVGSVPEIVQLLNGVAYASREQGDLDGAAQAADEGLRLAIGIDSKLAIATMLMERASIAIDAGDLTKATSLYKEALALCNESGNPHGVAGATTGLAVVSRRRGDLMGARRQYDDAERMLRQANVTGEIADLLAARVELQIEQPDLAGARHSLEEVRSIRANGSGGFAAASTGLSFALLALADSKPEEAGVLARQAEVQFRNEERFPAMASVLIVEARALLAMSRFREAAAKAGDAVSIAGQTQVVSLRAEAALVRGRALVAAGQVPKQDELRALERAAAGASDHRLIVEARLLATEVRSRR